MAFKIKSNNVGRYTVTPNIGICFPQEKLLVDIVLNGDLKDIANDKFQVIAVPYKIIGLESQITYRNIENYLQTEKTKLEKHTIKIVSEQNVDSTRVISGLSSSIKDYDIDF